MAKSVISAESELSSAANKITSYADFLSNIIESYISILSDLQENGIQDELICSKLASLSSDISPYKTLISNVCEELAAEVKEFISDVEQADNFSFPEDIISAIASIVEGFF